MPISVYTGLMRSGKSYEVVSEVILTAIAAGRRVITNVDGINNDLIRAYVSEKNKLPIDDIGEVVHVTNQDVFSESFFPYYDNAKGVHEGTFVKSGDLVCIDEAWRFWPASGEKIHNNHKSFFLEHGHFTHQDTGVACDLVLMIQDMGTLNRFIKSVVSFNFRTHKKVSLGLNSTYSVTMYEGYKQSKATETGSWVRKYKSEIFPLYSSFKGGANGKTVNVDKRQNIFSSKKLWLIGAGFLAFWVYFGFFIWGYFHPEAKKTDVANSAKVSVPGAPAAVSNKPLPSTSTASTADYTRIGGYVYLHGVRYLLVINGTRFSYYSPSQLMGEYPAQYVLIDGKKVTR